MQIVKLVEHYQNKKKILFKRPEIDITYLYHNSHDIKIHPAVWAQRSNKDYLSHNNRYTR